MKLLYFKISTFPISSREKTFNDNFQNALYTKAEEISNNVQISDESKIDEVVDSDAGDDVVIMIMKLIWQCITLLMKS